MPTCIPEALKAKLTMLKTLRREQTSRPKTGSQKAFFMRIWARLHAEPVPPPPPNEDANSASGGKVKPSPKKIYAPEDTTRYAVMSEMFTDALMKSEDGRRPSARNIDPYLRSTPHSTDGTKQQFR
jgi:hypothetical protein